MIPLPDGDLRHVLEHTAQVWASLKNARLFITGGTGFFGKWLLESFSYANRELSLGATAMVLSRDPRQFLKNMPHLAADGSIKFIQGDVCSFDPPGDSPTHIIHAATETTTRNGKLQPLEMLDTVVAGTHRVLELARQCRVRSLLFTSSGAVYGKQPPGLTHVPEDYTGAPDPLDPDAAYGNGKRYAEHLCAAYFAQHGIPVKLVRCFAFVGPHLPQDAHFAVGNFIRDALAGGPIVVNGDGTPFRSYLYAADLAIWLWTILAEGADSRAYNVGSSQAITIADLARKVGEKTGCSVHICQVPRENVPPLRYVPDVSRASSELNLRPLITLDEALDRTIEWSRRHPHKSGR